MNTHARPSHRRLWLIALVAAGVALALPLLGALSAPQADAIWRSLVAEDFSDGIGAGWIVTDTSALDGGQYMWGTDQYTSTSPLTAMWAVGGGLDGSELIAGRDPYPASLDTWLIYGPVDLSLYTEARVSFDWWLDSAEGDTLAWCVFTQPTGFTLQALVECDEVRWSGPIRTWARMETALDTLSPEAAATFIAFRFTSNDDLLSGVGAFIDDFLIEVPGEPHMTYLPLLQRDPVPTPIPVDLRNGDFEEDWRTESSNRVVIYYTDGRIEDTTRDNILTPPGWVTWFRSGMPVEHDPYNFVGWSQPIVEPTSYHDPDRMHDGEKGQMLYTFYRIHDAGFYQQLDVMTWTRLRVTAWAHAWSNLGESSPHPSDPYWSEGSHVGYTQFYTLTTAPDLDGSDRNFTFWVGIDPTGGTNPYAETVVWGEGAHVYNGYFQLPEAVAWAQSETVTIFLRSRTLWPFKHNDAYWDSVAVEVIR